METGRRGCRERNFVLGGSRERTASRNRGKDISAREGATAGLR